MTHATVSRAGWDDDPMTRPSDDTLLEMLHEAIRKSDDALAGHQRLRQTLMGVGERVQDVESCQTVLRVDVGLLKDRKPDLSQSIIPTRFWLAMATLACIVVGAAWSVKSDVRDISTQQSAEQKLNDERILTLRSTLDDLKKDAAMQRVQLESLTKMVISQQRRP